MTDPTVAILLVEDNPGDARLVKEMLDEGGGSYAVTHVETVGNAIAHLSAHPDGIDVVLLDLSLPDETGLETLRRVLAVRHQAGVVVMTGLGDDEVGVSATQEGARDYLVKGQVDYRTLRRALKLAMARHKREGTLEKESLTDELTGLHNRRGFLMLAEQQIKTARRNGMSIVLLFVDLDRFKQINDTYGHAEGDRALQETASVLRQSLRSSDVVGRIGGDEFVGLALSAVEGGDEAVRGRLQEALKKIRERPGRPYQLTFSVGVLCSPADSEETMETLLARADELMYQEKHRRHAAEDQTLPR
jgi:two-component system cell cycle response regulator